MAAAGCAEVGGSGATVGAMLLSPTSMSLVSIGKSTALQHCGAMGKRCAAMDAVCCANSPARPAALEGALPLCRLPSCPSVSLSSCLGSRLFLFIFMTKVQM